MSRKYFLTNLILIIGFFYCFGKNLNSKNTSKKLILNDQAYFIEESLNLTSLTIFPCAKLTFASMSVRIYVKYGKVDISGSEKCPISMQQSDSSKKVCYSFDRHNYTSR